MNSSLKYHSIVDFTTETGVVYDELELSYEKLIHNKVHNYELCIASPYGKKYLALWSSLFTIHVNKY